MQKQKARVQAPAHPPLTTHEAILNLATRLKRLEETSMVQMKAVELKLGDHEAMFTTGAPDMDQIADMFKVQNEKLDALVHRVQELEKKNGIKPAKSKGGTVKLTELVEDGLSFEE